MQSIINDIITQRDEYCSELNDIWTQLWEMAPDRGDPTVSKLAGHFAAAHERKEIKEMLLYIKELLFFVRKGKL